MRTERVEGCCIVVVERWWRKKWDSILSGIVSVPWSEPSAYWRVFSFEVLSPLYSLILVVAAAYTEIPFLSRAFAGFFLMAHVCWCWTSPSPRFRRSPEELANIILSSKYPSYLHVIPVFVGYSRRKVWADAACKGTRMMSSLPHSLVTASVRCPVHLSPRTEGKHFGDSSSDSILFAAKKTEEKREALNEILDIWSLKNAATITVYQHCCTDDLVGTV